MRFLDVSRVRVRFDQRIRLRDGVELSADLYIPPGTGPFPGLLVMTPYDNNRTDKSPHVGNPKSAQLLAAHGFVTALVDVRGRGDSDGLFTPFALDGEDGLEVCRWLASDSDCDGTVILVGTGYSALEAWATAARDSRDIRGVISLSPMSGPDEVPWVRGGALRLGLLFWLHLTTGRMLQLADLPEWREAWRCLPVSDMDQRLGYAADFTPWKSWVDGAASPASAARRVMREELGRQGPPAFHMTGWWDENLSSTLAYWQLLSTESSSPQTLVIGAWDHESVKSPQRIVGGFDFGPRSAVDSHELIVEAARSMLDHPGAPATGPRRVFAFVTGRNEWYAFDRWPPRSKPAHLFLRTAGRSNTKVGGGILGESPTEDSGVDAYDYDPQNPLEWQPNFESFSRTGLTLVLDQDFAEIRDDLLIYRSEPLDSELVVAGSPHLELFVRTNASSADFVAALSDRLPTGQSLHLSHAFRRINSRDLEPRTFTRLELTLGAVGHAFQPGHCVQLAITSSLFPLYDRNLGTAQASGDHEYPLAHQEIASGGQFPSRLTLPAAVDLREGTPDPYVRSLLDDERRLRK